MAPTSVICTRKKPFRDYARYLVTVGGECLLHWGYEWPGDLLEADHPEAADQASAGASITEYDIFGGSSPLSSMSPDIKQEIREVSWHPTTPDPNDLTPYASSEPELQYPETDEEVDQLDHASDSVGEAVWHKERQAQGRHMRAMSAAWEDKDNTWL
ncbi:hypothetical protein FIBSPDRAFT_966559 [Athelia psychrophila]|uniref:Uncharacterized protein n=1 Tax=Athelia psychrophila TaxID=1759441 RepID=A0A167WNM7_9AGAM|nr:hypothetical protein FIBSPDRAFT_966559 [Fibularhizoctonia sp. CBS 109695]